MPAAGDELEDDFALSEIDDNASGNESQHERTAALSGEEDDWMSDEPSTSIVTQKKRKADESAAIEDGNSETGADKNPKKKKKRTKSSKKHLRSDEALIGTLPPSLQADYLDVQLRATFDKLSSLELESMHILESSLVDSTSYQTPRTADTLVDFIAKTLPDVVPMFNKKSKTNGAPRVLIISSAGQRAADLVRVLRTYQGEGGVIAKLFAKHMKVAEQTSYIQGRNISIAVGTPSRIIQLLELESLKISNLSHIILDSSYTDEKQRSLLQMPETRDQVFKLFQQPALREKLGLGHMKIVLY